MQSNKLIPNVNRKNVVNKNDKKVYIKKSYDDVTECEKKVTTYESLIESGQSPTSAYLSLTYEHYYNNTKSNSNELAKKYCVHAVNACFDEDAKYTDIMKDAGSIAYIADLLGICNDKIVELYKKVIEYDPSNIVNIRNLAKIYMNDKHGIPNYEDKALKLYTTNFNIKI